MVDPYQPALADVTFDTEEIEVIALALAGDSPWDYLPGTDMGVAALKRAKAKILSIHLQRHGWTCCYCRTNLRGAGPFMTDREHILPKGKPAYKDLSYELWNLAAACKRCNLQFKRSGDLFLIDADNTDALKKGENYRFIHPNFDNWEGHLIRLGVQVDAQVLVKIMMRDTAKAQYTYDFFGLKHFETDSFDTVQGLASHERESEAVSELRRLAEVYGQ